MTICEKCGKETYSNWMKLCPICYRKSKNAMIPKNTISNDELSKIFKDIIVSMEKRTFDRYFDSNQRLEKFYKDNLDSIMKNKDDPELQKSFSNLQGIGYSISLEDTIKKFQQDVDKFHKLETFDDLVYAEKGLLSRSFDVKNIMVELEEKSIQLKDTKIREILKILCEQNFISIYLYNLGQLKKNSYTLNQIDSKRIFDEVAKIRLS